MEDQILNRPFGGIESDWNATAHCWHIPRMLRMSSLWQSLLMYGCSALLQRYSKLILLFPAQCPSFLRVQKALIFALKSLQVLHFKSLVYLPQKNVKRRLPNCLLCFTLGKTRSLPSTYSVRPTNLLFQTLSEKQPVKWELILRTSPRLLTMSCSFDQRAFLLASRR